MDTARWQDLRQLFDAVCDEPPARWERRLRALSDDPALIAEALELLHAQTACFDRALQPLRELIASRPEAELLVGERLGAWRLVERLGSGGMGTVFVAERADGLFRQRVAIKLLRGAPGSGATAERLAAERQILAELQHPDIARLYDGGTTPAGSPYLVMEYVEGRPLDEYCEQAGPSLRQRLEMFLRICRAVQAAHQRLVVHCDLKPGNVLVRPGGDPVLLDFGIARLLDAEAPGEASAFCTPAYASPELLAGKSVSVVSDVFSLGILLTELLACRRSGRGAADIGALVPVPSALARAACPWPGRLPGDLDAIAARACALDPYQRYPSVEALAADIERHMQRRPVLARAPTLRYRTGRWLHRHWRESAAAATVVLATGVFVWQLGMAQARAEREAEVASQVADFLIDAFSVDTGVAQGLKGPGEISAREVLDRGVARVGASLAHVPDMQARLRLVLARAYLGLGVPGQAEGLLRQAVDDYLRADVARPLDAAEVLSELSALMANQMRGAEALEAAQRSLALRQAGGDSQAALADAYNVLGLALLRNADLAAAREALERSLAISRRLFGEGTMPTSSALHNLGLLHREMGDNIASEVHYRQALQIRRRHGLRSDAVQSSLQGLAVTLGAQGRHGESVELLRENLALAGALYGIDSDKVAKARLRLGIALQDRGDYREAHQHLQRALATSEQVGGADGLDHAHILNAYAGLLAARGDAAGAERAYRRVLAIRRRHLPAADRALLRTAEELALVLARQQRVAEADGAFQGALPRWRRIYRTGGAGPLELAAAQLRHAEWLLRRGGLDAAEASLKAPLDGQPPMQLRARALKAELAQARGDWSGAAGHWEALIERGVALHGVDSVVVAKWRVPYAQALVGEGRWREAQEQLRLATPSLRREMVVEAPVLRQVGALGATLTATRGGAGG
ncbi:tetratricopeptide repeat protein [Luteimonas sp. RD2P54]|uniref:Tetratricopeptide repeat protein n=1 Tax=Luteimonas endophytica TaxID=3042023 RepID=A0ABT6J9Y4_9GAMM|nr:serine/threonine-protein kinase [Luteimonas endophytica]MDH5823003.1 tetratricopeptide repeat protein [Luteimonas endophytica]